MPSPLAVLPSAPDRGGALSLGPGRRSQDYAGFRRQCSLLLLLAGLLGLSPFLGPAQASADETATTSAPLTRASFADIVDRYAFVGDFRQKPAERPISPELFWRYPFTLPRAQFAIDYQLGEAESELPATEGDDRPTQHLNRGRVLFRAGDAEQARQVWLSARARYGKDFAHHRRNDYFIALGFLKASERLLTQAGGDFRRTEVRLSHANAATFFSWAFIKKRDLPDARLTELTPAGLYNLAAIYFQYERYQGAHATAEEGLNFLRATGRRERRGDFRRMIAETWIRDHNYLRAVQELDTMIRQEVDALPAARAFARVGDIYFDLNNYELAEEAYAISQNIDAQIKQVVPLSAILRGEALFWLGRYGEAQTLLQFGLDSTAYKNAVAGLEVGYRAWASLRIADAYLARYRQAAEAGSSADERSALLNKSRLAYFQVGHSFPKSEAAKIAAVRRACLELPTYEGKNVGHARRDLAATRSADLPLQAIELAWSCQLLSYAQREKDLNFISELKAFYHKFPASRFLDQYVPYVKEIRASHLDEYFAAGDLYRATAFFENYRALLFASPSREHQQQLFAAYVDIFASSKASPFWQAYQAKKPAEAIDSLRLAVFLSEMADYQPKAQAWREAGRQLARQLEAAPPLLTYSPAAMQTYWQRLLASSQAPQHLSWMSKLAQTWGQDDAGLLCELATPLLSRRLTLARSPSTYNELATEVRGLTQKWLPGLLQKDQACSEALLNLEAKLAHLAPLPADYGRLWLARSAWPQKRLLIPLLWDAAERLAQANDQANAEALWLFLSKQDGSLYPEAAFARARLDKSQTTVEDLWQ